MTETSDRPLPEAMAAAFAAAIARYEREAPLAASILFGAILTQAPDHPQALRLRGLSLVRAGRPEAALPDLRAARRLAPADPLSHLHYGIGLQEAGYPVRAAAMFRRATVMMPGNAAPWINLSAALLALGHTKAARAAARRALGLAPRDADASYMIGLADLAAGDLRAAQEAFAEAVYRRPDFAQAWTNLVLALARGGNIAFANRAIERGRAACPEDGTLAAAAAGFAIIAGDHDRALALLRDVLDRDPDCLAARLNLANALLLDGEGLEALTLLGGPPPSGRNGAHWLAHRSLALLQLSRDADAERDLDAIREPYGDAEILILWRRIQLATNARREKEAEALADRLSTLAETDGESLFEHRVIAHFDLARYRDGRGEKFAAFGHWRAGHSLIAQIQPFSRDTCAAFFETTIQTYDAAHFAHGPAATNTDALPVFIVGLPRSGTSLTEQIIASHALIHGGGERTTIHDSFVRLTRRAALDPEAVRTAATLDAATLTGEAAAIMEDMHALAPEARMVSDKMPANALHLGFVATLLPKARVIICQRDPRDIGLSIFQLRFFGYHPYAHDLGDLGWYIAAHERLMEHWRAVLPLAILTVNLTDWVHDFAGTLARVLDFLELPHDPACEHFFEQKRRLRTASAQQVRQPINARGLGRWRAFASELAPMISELEAAHVIPVEERT